MPCHLCRWKHGVQAVLQHPHPFPSAPQETFHGRLTVGPGRHLATTRDHSCSHFILYQCFKSSVANRDMRECVEMLQCQTCVLIANIKFSSTPEHFKFYLPNPPPPARPLWAVLYYMAPGWYLVALCELQPQFVPLAKQRCAKMSQTSYPESKVS